MKTMIVKREFTSWEDHKQICLTHIEYKLQYEKNFLGIKYWRNFKEFYWGIEGYCSSTIWMKDKKALINRFNCVMNETKYTFE